MSEEINPLSDYFKAVRRKLAKENLKNSSEEETVEKIAWLQEECIIRDAALDLHISRSSGKSIDDPRVQELKEMLINEVKNESINKQI